MTKIAVIGTPGGWSSETLADSVAEKTGFRLLVDMAKVRLVLPDGKFLYEDTDLAELDGLIIKKIGSPYSPDLLDRLESLRYLANSGMPIFSHPERIIRVLDRLACTITLQNGGIPMPLTTITEDPNHARQAVADYGNAVFKPLFSTKARGMCIINDDSYANQKIEEYRRDNVTMYIQKRIDIGKQDLGIVFLGGEYLTTYGRCKTSDTWNTTTASGGKYAAFDPDEEIIALANKAQALFGLDFTCVDVALTPDGPEIFEVSAFGGFRGIQVARGIDAAAAYTHYALQRISS